MTQAERESLKLKLLDLVPPEGEKVTNASLIASFIELTEPGMPTGEEERRALYWVLRNELIENGDLEKGKGQGGSVRRAAKLNQPPEATQPAAAETGPVIGQGGPVAQAETPETPTAKEMDLYEPFIQALKAGYISEYKIPRDHLLIKTANAGSKNTGGKWTRPDVALIAVHSYPFLPNKSLEVTTFEIKKNIDDAMEGVFESLAHSAFAHRTYLAVKVEGTIPKELAEKWTRIREECDRLAIGLIKFSNAQEYETFEFISEAAPNDPELYKVNEFISKQVGTADQEIVREWVR